MTPFTVTPSREEVLDAFAVEPNHGRETLERYLRQYPAYAGELVDLSRELSRRIVEHVEPLSGAAQVLIDTAWQRHFEARPVEIADPLTDLPVEKLREIAKQLDVPRQIVTAFRERRVTVASVPSRFLARFASAVNAEVGMFREALSRPSAPKIARSYKAESKPEAGASVSFEQLLIDAGVPPEKRAALMEEDD